MGTVKVRNPPKTGSQAVERALRDLRGRPGPREVLGGAEIKLWQPLPVYRLALDDIRTRRSIGNAELVGWRYVVERADGGTGSAYADVRVKRSGDSKFVSFSKNRHAGRLAEAAHLAQQVAADLPSDFEARILDVPAVYMSAIWLTSPEPIFIPYIDADRLADPKANILVDPDFVDRLLKRALIARQHFASESFVSRIDVGASPIEVDSSGIASIPRPSLMEEHSIAVFHGILIATVLVQIVLTKIWTS